MLFLYNLAIRLYSLLIRLASLRSKKAAAWITGRKDLLSRMGEEITTGENRVWFHFASLGEFEQGRPVLEEVKLKAPETSIIITFFSPSGYEIRKDYQLADHVFYLPLDTRKNAREFIRLVKPKFAIFTKYEYWYHYFDELHQKEIPLFIVSGIFRENQAFFKWYGGLHREMLRKVSHFFIQNEMSEKLLGTLGLKNITVTGDTRFDRVLKHSKQVKPIPEVEQFCHNWKIFIAGSTWPADESLLSDLSRDFSDWKFIIAPHETNSEHIRQIEKLFPSSVRLSNISSGSHKNRILIIDSIGLLSSLYQYGDIGYIGGGFGVGIHNTQEAAAFGLPVLFGPNFDKFQEARDMIDLGAAFSIKNLDELSKRMQYLCKEEARSNSGQLAKDYIQSNAGATGLIINYLGTKGYIN